MLPEDSEPNVRPFAWDIDDAIAIMKDAEGKDFGDNELCCHHIRLNGYLREQFPGCAINPLDGYGGEGVITSAVMMRGQDFFIDLYDEPEKVREYLSLLNRSIIRFFQWSNHVNGQPELAGWCAWLADDFAALIPPDLWRKFVVPYWIEYFEGRTTARRWTFHCEGTAPEQLKYLKETGITRYQPSVSEKLTLENVRPTRIYRSTGCCMPGRSRRCPTRPYRPGWTKPWKRACPSSARRSGNTPG
ncbi:MAG: hypothetical protein IKS52_11230 [Clostridia bacterium]|nr:hypothetical protein [Clostridia bacterium]